MLKGKQGKPYHPVSDANSSKSHKDNSSESSREVPENDVKDEVQETRFGRKTKLPVWMQDYVQ